MKRIEQDHFYTSESRAVAGSGLRADAGGVVMRVGVRLQYRREFGKPSDFPSGRVHERGELDMKDHGKSGWSYKVKLRADSISASGSVSLSLGSSPDPAPRDPPHTAACRPGSCRKVTDFV